MIIPAHFPTYVFRRENDDAEPLPKPEFAGTVVAWVIDERADGEPFVEAGLTAEGHTIYAGDSGYEFRTPKISGAR